MLKRTLRALLGAVVGFALWGPAASSAPAITQNRDCMQASMSFGELMSCRRGELSTAVYSVSVFPALPCKGDDIVVDISLETQAGILVVRKWSKGCRGERRLQWIDGLKCPALGPQLERLSAMDDVRIETPRTDRSGLRAVHDGAYYELHAPAVFRNERASGSIIVSGNVDSPVASWVEQTFGVLKSCWVEGMPRQDWLPSG